MMTIVREWMRGLWAEPRVVCAPGPNRRDVGLLACVCAVAALEVALRAELSWWSAELALDLALLSSLLWRRQRPLQAVVFAFGACTAAALLRPWVGRDLLPLNTLAFMLLLPYSLLRWGAGREVLIGVPITLAAAASDLITQRAPVSDVVGGYAVLLVAMALGLALRFREREQRRGIEQAKQNEREQLARDLHDTVAHHVSAIAIRAQAGLAVSSARPEAASEALRLIADEASATLAEMRGIVRVLRRSDPAELAPQPQVGDLARLAQPVAQGPEVSVTLSGELEVLPPSISSALYRLAQESITNARRHARQATRIDVAVRAEGAWVRLEVRDDGERSATRSLAPRGFGLVGMTERAQLLGGSCTAGPAPDRGWTVTVVLPRAERSS